MLLENIDQPTLAPSVQRVAKLRVWALPLLGGLVLCWLGAPPAGADDGHSHSRQLAAASSTSEHHNRFKPLEEGVRAVHGLRIYRDFCVSCHGKFGDGKGDKAAELDKRLPDFTAFQALVKYTREHMLEALKKGHGPSKEGTTSQRLAERDMVDVVNFIQDAFMLPSGEADSSIGRKIYARTCSVCHGDRGNAASWAKNSLNPSPFDFTSYKAKKLSRRHMINTVTYGSEKTAMVGFATQLSAIEIAAVVNYIQQTFIFHEKILSEPKAEKPSAEQAGDHQKHDHKKHVGADGKFAMTRAFEGGVAGTPNNGKTLYEKNCAPCHGLQGNGDGPRAYFIFPRPENFTGKRAGAELNRPHLFASISKGIVGTVMPAWSTVLTDAQIADVAEYVFSTFVMVDNSITPSKLFQGDGAGKITSSGHQDHQRTVPPSKKN